MPNVLQGVRSLGIGVIGLAHYFAKHGVKYGDPEAWALTHELFEAFQYTLIGSSADLAKNSVYTIDDYIETKYYKGPSHGPARSVDKLS